MTDADLKEAEVFSLIFHFVALHVAAEGHVKTFYRTVFHFSEILGHVKGKNSSESERAPLRQPVQPMSKVYTFGFSSRKIYMVRKLFHDFVPFNPTELSINSLPY
jgi:hypothetical protein